MARTAGADHEHEMTTSICLELNFLGPWKRDITALELYDGPMASVSLLSEEKRLRVF